jgi:penicillin-binding protein 1C
MFACAALAYVFRPLIPPPQDGRALEFTDRNGLWLGTLLARDASHAAFVPLERIAPAFVGAVLAAEDARFFSHGAIDSLAAARALGAAIRTHRIPGGASTISMQLARIVAPVDPGWRGKLEETIDAQRLENGNSKRAIFEAYCNRVPMGANIYGVEAAARTYFGIGADQLDLAQAALLAAIPNDPTRLDPYAHWNRLRARQRYVLARMVAAGFAQTDDARRAAREEIALSPRGGGILAAAHFLFAVASRVPQRDTVARTTIDLPLQRFVETQVRDVVRGLGDHDVHQAAAIVVDNRTRQILAYVGSTDYFDDLAFGRNDGVQALRQPGSALKPFLYELALERRAIRPTTILLDEPATYAIPGGKLYQPGDYSGRFAGPVRVRVALADSLNVPAVRVLDRVGVDAFLERLHLLGFAHLRGTSDYYGLGLGLGGGEVSLYELARAYVTLARGGAPGELVGLLSAAPARSAAGATQLDPAWALVTDILADPHARAGSFGVHSVLALPFAAAVKTGTSSGFRDTWTVGYSRDYTVGAWVGNFDGRPMRHVSGVSGAGPLWNRIMLHLHEPREPGAFAPPAGYVRRPICAETGAKPAPGCRAVVSEWLDPGDVAAYARPRRPSDRPAASLIAFPNDGDRFVLAAGGAPQRIVVQVDATQPERVRATADGVALRNDGGAFVLPLRLGAHEIVARDGARSGRVQIVVERPPARRAGFTALPH